MKEFKVSKYIRKKIPLIVTVCAVMTVLVFFLLSSTQTYVASSVIEFTDEDAQYGKTPKGTDLDVNEIKSASVMAKVIQNLELGDDYSIDDLISRVAIAEVMDPDEKARKEALLETGEEYEYKPTRFIVSFTANYDEGKTFAQSILDEILDTYFSHYSEKYVNEWSISNSIGDISNTHYDYIQMLEIIDENISNTVKSLDVRVNGSDYFRSSITGYSFADIAREFTFIYDNKLSDLYARVLEHQITKNKATLLADYQNRIIQNDINYDIKNDQVADVELIINDYVEKMAESGNTDLTYEYILDNVYGRTEGEEGAPQVETDKTVTYDRLIYDWRDHSDEKKYATIDSAYRQYIINTFSKCYGNCGGNNACRENELTCSAINNSDYSRYEESLTVDIKSLTDELDNLYKIIADTDNEYNEYLGAQQILTLSSVSVKEGTNVLLYSALAAVFFMVLCSCGAVLIGRLNDIIHYSFYTDHLTDLNNSASLDNFLKAKADKILSNGAVCFTVQIRNTREINQSLGRTSGDQLLALIAKILKETFSDHEAFLVYNGGAAFIAFVAHMSYEDAQNSVQEFVNRLDSRETLQEASIEYDIGIAESGSSDSRNLRKLLSAAMASKSSYVSESKKNTNG